jgi:Cd2+/Zn2+-exporting ATPase
MEADAVLREEPVSMGVTTQTKESEAARTGRVECSLGTEGCQRCAAGESEFNPKTETTLILSSLVLLVLGLVFREALHATPYQLGEYAILLPAYFLAGWNVLWTAFRNLARGRLFDENSLMTIATIGAIVIHQLPEAVGVMLFFKVGEFLQERSVSRSRRSIRALLDVRPDFANVQRGSGLERVSPERVNVGDTIVIKPGEKVPLDGDVLEGNSLVDTSALTGESVPRSVGAGETILAGMISTTGWLTVRVTRESSQSSVSRILEMVESAASRKAPTERFITTFARYYTPAVVAAAAAVALIPPLVIPGATFSQWIYRALVLLVISCPCALVISIPLGYFGGIGGASRKGILIKGANFLDTLAKVKTAVFDKTGTLTKGTFKVTQIVPHNGFTAEGLLHLAAEVESLSNHPIAQSIKEACGEPVNVMEVEEYKEIPGSGIRARIDGRVLYACNDRGLHQANIEHPICEIEGTAVHLAVDEKYAGYVVISDEIKEDAADAVVSLRRLGVERVLMLTGDRAVVASSVARNTGIDSFLSDLLPEDKVAEVEKLAGRDRRSGKVAFVGDGINDAPVIARADVGVAMGALGSDAAIESADVVLMTDDPSKLGEAIGISKKTRHIVWQNIVMALGIKGVFIALGIVGVATIWEAVFADVGVALLAILNATRAMR